MIESISMVQRILSLEDRKRHSFSTSTSTNVWKNDYHTVHHVVWRNWGGGVAQLLRYAAR